MMMSRHERHGIFGVYVRRSEDDESGRSKSCDDQESRGTKTGLMLGYREDQIRIYREPEGAKGTWWWEGSGQPGPHRKALGRAVADINTRELEALWAWNSDRVFRDVPVALALGAILCKANVTFYCGLKQVDTSSADGLYHLTIEAASNRRQRDRAREDVQRDKLFRAELGLFTRDPSCFGWKSAGRESQEAIPQWDQIDTAEMMMRWLVGDGDVGPLTQNQIANRLMDLGVKLSIGAKGHKASNDRLVTYQQVERILRNPMFIGMWQHAGKLYDFREKLYVSRNGEPKRPAVPVELFERVQQRLKARPKKGTKLGCSGRLLAGIVVCGACGRTLHVGYKILKDGSKTQRYFCPNRIGKAKTCTGISCGSLVVEELDSWVTEYLGPLLAHELQAMRQEAASGPAQAELAIIERKITEIKASETEKLTALVVALDADQLAAVAAQFRTERQRLERRASELRVMISSVGGESLHLSDLLSVSTEKLREALKRTVRWIALTDRGVVAATYSCAYMGAAYEESQPGKMKGKDNRRKLLPGVGAAASNVCATWIAEPAKFIAGRRHALKELADSMTDQELLPS